MSSDGRLGAASTLFVTGATGVIGRRVVPLLVEAGPDVVAVVRTDAAARTLAHVGARVITVDLFDSRAVHAATAGCDAFVHLATNVPPMTRMGMRHAWDAHNRLRTDATRNLLDAARAHGVTRVVKESITFTYSDRGAEWIDESSPLDDANPTWGPTIAGDRLVLAFNDEGGAGTLLRFGSLYAPEARSTDEYLRVARVHVAPVPGRADAYVSSTTPTTPRPRWS